MEDELVICCMDRRLNVFLENNYKDAIVLRNAGANVAPLMPLIKQIVRENGIRKITLITHDDCGAMAKTFSVLKENGKATEELRLNLIEQFEKVKFTTKEELENANTNLQLASLKSIFPELNVEAKPARMKDINAPKDDEHHKLLVVSPGKPSYDRIFKVLEFNPFQCYVIQASIENAMPDIELTANDLHAKEVYFIVGDNDNPRDVKRDADMASLKLSKLDAEVKRQDIRTVRKSYA